MNIKGSPPTDMCIWPMTNDTAYWKDKGPREQVSLQRESRHQAISICREVLTRAPSITPAENSLDTPWQIGPMRWPRNASESPAQPRSLSFTHPGSRLWIRLRTHCGIFPLSGVHVYLTQGYRFLTTDNKSGHHWTSACIFYTWIPRWGCSCIKTRVKILSKSEKIQIPLFNEIITSADLLYFTEKVPWKEMSFTILSYPNASDIYLGYRCWKYVKLSHNHNMFLLEWSIYFSNFSKFFFSPTLKQKQNG